MKDKVSLFSRPRHVHLSWWLISSSLRSSETSRVKWASAYSRRVIISTKASRRRAELNRRKGISSHEVELFQDLPQNRGEKLLVWIEKTEKLVGVRMVVKRLTEDRFSPSPILMRYLHVSQSRHELIYAPIVPTVLAADVFHGVEMLHVWSHSSRDATMMIRIARHI